MKQEQLQTITRARLEPSKRFALENATWEYAPTAQSLTEAEFAQLQPSSGNVERALLTPNWETVIGGVCQIFTGDLQANQAAQAVQLIRLDQLVETVGLVSDAKTLFVAEDSFFAALTGVELPLLTRQAQEIEIRLQRIGTTIGVQDVQMVLTSDIETALKEQVSVLAQVVGNPTFATLNAAPVMLMYTQLWSELLSSLGYLKSPAVLCFEPVIHFKEKQRFESVKQQRAYEDFINWLQSEPYAQPKSRNSQFGIAGFTPILSPDNAQQRTRLRTFDQVANSENYFDWIKRIDQARQDFIFPLSSSFLYGEAVNYLLWNEVVQEALLVLANLEQDYKQEREELKTLSVPTPAPSQKPATESSADQKSTTILLRRQAAEQLRTKFQQLTQTYVNEIADALCSFITLALGEK